MLQGTEKHRKNIDYAWIREWSVGERWRESYRLKHDRERVNKLQSQWVQIERELIELVVKVQHWNPEVFTNQEVSCPQFRRGRRRHLTRAVRTQSQPIALKLSDSDGEVDKDFVENDMGVADARERSGSRVINDQIMHWEYLSPNYAGLAAGKAGKMPKNPSDTPGRKSTLGYISYSCGPMSAR
tara:strand:+ start:182 stop:733 length:552 start_codon:yes stop_codon:yes gene_type:complete